MASKPYQFQPGKSGNPGGRTKAHRELARYIRDKTQDGKELADICLAIARDPDAERRVRLIAIEWLGDRGIGKPVQAVDLRVEEGQPVEQSIDWSKVPLERRQALLEALSLLDDLAADGSSETDQDDHVEH